jgi:hypothetical protein
VGGIDKSNPELSLQAMVRVDGIGQSAPRGGLIASLATYRFGYVAPLWGLVCAAHQRSSWAWTSYVLSRRKEPSDSLGVFVPALLADSGVNTTTLTLTALSNSISNIQPNHAEKARHSVVGKDFGEQVRRVGTQLAVVNRNKLVLDEVVNIVVFERDVLGLVMHWGIFGN